MKKRLLATIPVLLVVFLCSYGVNADTLLPEETNSQTFNYLDNDFTVYVNSVIYKPFLVDYDYNFVTGRTYFGTSMTPYPADPYNWNSSGTTRFYDVPVTINVNFTNKSDYLVYANTNYIGITPNFTFNKYPDCWYVEELSDDVALYQITQNGGQFRFSMVNQNLTYNGKLAISKWGVWNFSFKIHFLYHYTEGALNGTTYPQIDGTTFNTAANYVNFNGVTLNAPASYTVSNVDPYANQNITFWQIKELLSSIREKITNRDNAYNSVNTQSSDLENNSDSFAQQSDTVHNQETGYYTQTNTALTNTGLSNFSFGNTTINAIALVKDQFTYVWNKLNTYSIVYTFSLTLGVALMIIRHVRPIRRKKEE